MGVKFGEVSLLEIKLNGGKTQKSNGRRSGLEETFRTNESHQLFYFTDGETQVHRRKGTDRMSHSSSVSELRPEPTAFSPSLSASHVQRMRTRRQRSSPLGWEVDGGGTSLELRLVLILWSCPRQSCKVKNFINISLLRLLENPKSQLLWVMGHALSIQ